MTTPRITVFTPVTPTAIVPGYFAETYRSLREQSFDDWEWILVPNTGAQIPPEIPRTDPRVRICPPPGDLAPGIGALKRYACNCAHPDARVLFELDHDDVLHLEALTWAHAAMFGLDEADFVYSDFAEFHQGTYAPNPFSARYGWEGYPTTGLIDGAERALIAMRAPEATPAMPHSIRRIEWAPNHLRAWRREFYWQIGGHNPVREVADDFDLVLRGFLAGGRYRRIPECLYFYRVHAAQTVSQRNAAIQTGTQEIYDENFEALALMFARANGFRAIDLCGGINCRPGFEPADLSTGVDLDGRWPWEDGSVGVLRANDALEHLRSPTHVMAEAYRVLAPGGIFLTRTPSTEGRGAWCDPTHVSFWNELSFRYYTQAAAQKFIAHCWGKRLTQRPGYYDDSACKFVEPAFYPPSVAPRFATSLLRTAYPDEWHAANRLSYVEWHGIALKPGYHHMGDCDPQWRKDCAPLQGSEGVQGPPSGCAGHAVGVQA